MAEEFLFDKIVDLDNENRLLHQTLKAEGSSGEVDGGLGRKTPKIYGNRHKCGNRHNSFGINVDAFNVNVNLTPQVTSFDIFGGGILDKKALKQLFWIKEVGYGY